MKIEIDKDPARNRLVTASLLDGDGKLIIKAVDVTEDGAIATLVRRNLQYFNLTEISRTEPAHEILHSD